MKMTVLLAIAACAAISVSLFAAEKPQRRIEVSSDGHESVVLEGAETPGVGWKARGSSVPFGVTPDWTYDVRRQVGGLRLVDMNGDNLLDVVAVCYNSSSFPPYVNWQNFILYNTGTEPEAAPSWISADQVHTGNLDVGLINNDIYPDIFAANGNSFTPSVIYFGGPAGPSTSPGWTSAIPGGAWSTSAKIFDVDHDGDMDVFTSNQGTTNDPFRPIHWFRNNNGVLETAPSWVSAESSIQGALDFGDLDGDGWEDLAVSKWANFQSGIYKNVNGTLQTTPIWTTGLTGTDRGVVWADFDGDNDKDLIVGESPTRLFTNTAGVLSPTWSGAAPFYSHSEMLAADMDGDGDDDFVEVHFGDGRCHVYINRDGVLDSTPTWTYDSSAVGAALAVGDIDGNGRLDLAIGYAGNTSIAIFFAEDFPVCPADIAAPPGTVDVFDLFALLSAWGTNGSGADLAAPTNIVDVFDLFVLLSAWGPC